MGNGVSRNRRSFRFFEVCTFPRNLTKNYRKSECQVKEVWVAGEGRQVTPMLYFRCIFS